MTAIELLDDPEYEGAVEMLVDAYLCHTMCPECGHVDDEMETLMNHPCQTCGTNVECRQVLFHTQEPLLKMIFECYKSDHSNELCVLLFCALTEQHIRNLIKSRCVRLNLDWAVIDLLLDGYEKVHERMRLFERLTGVKMKDAVGSLPVASVFETYATHAGKRNGIAHGHPGATFAITKENIRSAVTAAANSFSCFAYLHHRYCAVDSPPMPQS